MPELRRLLKDNSDAIVGRWLDYVLRTYPKDGAAAFARQKDPFANPVGHSLRVGTRAIFDCIVAGESCGDLRTHLGDVIKIRAVQQFTASQAVGFVFLLKDAIRKQLGAITHNAAFKGELDDLDRTIDRLALDAFDIFVQCREQLCELRINEVKRSVSWVVQKMNERDRRPELAGSEQGPE